MAKEKNLMLRRILGIVSLVALIANIFLRLALKTYGDLVFWAIILVIAFIAWPVMNYLKK